MAAVHRLDVHKWRKWQFYPGAMTLLLPRILIGISFCILLLICLSILLIGYDRKKPMQDGCRKFCIRWIYYFVSSSISIFAFFTLPRTKFVTEEEVGYYEEYLGTREEQAAAQAKPDIE